jgi:methylated-DNA-[protein]-cysteine S-methyltransferase
MTVCATWTIATPDGPFTVVADDWSVVASGWAPNAAELLDRVRLAGIELRTRWPGADNVAERAVAAVEAYYGGQLTAPSQVPVRATSAAFHQQVRLALRATAPGQRLSYAELAARAGHAGAARAAGTACARNTVALFVPCHRAVRGDGSLGGFLYGLDIKRRLLDRERA